MSHRIIDEMAATALELDGRDLLARGRSGHHGEKRQADEAGKIGFGNGRRAAGRLHDRAALAQPAIAQGVEKQRARQTVLEAARGVTRFIFQIQINPGKTGQGQRDQVGIAGALEVGFDAANGSQHPSLVRATCELSRRFHAGSLTGSRRETKAHITLPQRDVGATERVLQRFFE
jgi:hypothetical protein